jgi:hypothetical protein
MNKISAIDIKIANFHFQQQWQAVFLKFHLFFHFILLQTILNSYFFIGKKKK